LKRCAKYWLVGQRSYSQWKSQFVSERKQRVLLVKEKITCIYFDSKQRYGSARIREELASLGTKSSRITVAKYIQELGLRNKFKVTPNSKHKYLIVSNILNREFSVRESSKVYVLDITYIRVKEGSLYLTTVLDGYDGKNIGLSLSNGMSVKDTSLAA
jgi:putative transposase